LRIKNAHLFDPEAEGVAVGVEAPGVVSRGGLEGGLVAGPWPRRGGGRLVALLAGAVINSLRHELHDTGELPYSDGAVGD